MDEEEWVLMVPGMLSPAGDEIMGQMTWACNNTEQPIDRIEMALLRFQRAHPSVHLVRTDGKVVTEWALLLGSLPLGFLRVSRKHLEIDASVQALQKWLDHASSAEGRRLWLTFLIRLYEEMRVGAAVFHRPDGKSEPKRQAGKRTKQVKVPKGTTLAKWTATWRYIRPHVERGLTNPRDLLGLLARDRNTEHLAIQSEDTMRKIVLAGLAGRLNGPE